MTWNDQMLWLSILICLHESFSDCIVFWYWLLEAIVWIWFFSVGRMASAKQSNSADYVKCHLLGMSWFSWKAAATQCKSDIICRCKSWAAIGLGGPDKIIKRMCIHHSWICFFFEIHELWLSDSLGCRKVDHELCLPGWARLRAGWTDGDLLASPWLPVMSWPAWRLIVTPSN